jgi:hypothetical protein
MPPRISPRQLQNYTEKALGKLISYSWNKKNEITRGCTIQKKDIQILSYG